MLNKTFTAIALTNRDFPTFEAKVREAVGWIDLAGRQGSDLIVLPEAINFFENDGASKRQPGDATRMALEHWEAPIEPIVATASRHGAAVVVPLVIREGGELVNCFFLFDGRGELAGRFEKMYPTPEGLAEATRVSVHHAPLAWEGLRVGGAICFDTCFPAVFETQAAEGVDLFVVPSLWPGGVQLQYHALRFGTPMVVAYPAWSRIIDIDGHEIAGGGYRHETLRFGFGTPLVSATLNFNRVVLFANHNQAQIAHIQRKYTNRVRVAFNQDNCLFVLESLCADLPVREIMREFELIDHQTYFKQAEALRDAHVDTVASGSPKALP